MQANLQIMDNFQPSALKGIKAQKVRSDDAFFSTLSSLAFGPNLVQLMGISNLNPSNLKDMNRQPELKTVKELSEWLEALRSSNLKDMNKQPELKTLKELSKWLEANIRPEDLITDGSKSKLPPKMTEVGNNGGDKGSVGRDLLASLIKELRAGSSKPAGDSQVLDQATEKTFENPVKELLSRLEQALQVKGGNPVANALNAGQKQPSPQEVVSGAVLYDSSKGIDNCDRAGEKNGKTSQGIDLDKTNIFSKLNLNLQETGHDGKNDSNKGNNTLLFSNHKMSEGFHETISQAKDVALPYQKSLQSTVLNQIVDKAALSLKRGKTSIEIRLKPEFLGRLQMKVATEHHQVMIRILTDTPLVKDMINNNMHELRNALQNHGLEINNFDVFVACDSNDYRGEYQGQSLLNMEGESGTAEIQDITSNDKERPGQSVNQGRGGNSIDFFA